MNMNDTVIPCRHDTVVCRLAGVPVRRDVAVLAGKDGENGGILADHPMNLVGGGHMPDQPVVRGQKHRNVIRQKTAGPCGDQRGEREFGDECGDSARVGLDEMGWQIHVKTRYRLQPDRYLNPGKDPKHQ